jgi:anaerobic selenocysteine-containing dehydrogenase
VKDGKVVGAEPADGDANNGILCVKGKFGYEFINHPDRLKKPLIKKDGEFVEASWEAAYRLIGEKFQAVKAAHGADAFAASPPPGLPTKRTTCSRKWYARCSARTMSTIAPDFDTPRLLPVWQQRLAVEQ